MVGDGLVHVVNFQMGQFPIGDYVIPGLRENLYGRFAVNLGVRLPAVDLVEFDRPPPAFVHEYHCTIRDRLGSLAFGEDTWWDLDHRVVHTGIEIVRLIDMVGLPFLDQFEGYASVLATLDRTGNLPSRNEGRAALDGALICTHLGQHERAAVFFDRADELAANHKGFKAHVAQVRRSCRL